MLSDPSVLQPEPYTTNGGHWGPSGTIGAPGGTVTWSIVGAGFGNNNPTSSSFSGSSVSLASFLPFDYAGALTQAFAAWSAVANINFVQVADGGGNMGAGTTGNIRIFGGRIDGPSNTLASAYSPPSGTANASALNGDVVFDSEESWTLSEFLNTATHEIGHALGLSHSTDTGAIMYAYANGVTTLQPDDIAGIRSIYGPRTATVADDYLATSGTTGAVAVNGRSAGSLETLGDHDWFRVQLTGGVSYTITERGSGSGFGTLSDPFLRLYSSSGALLSSNDDGDGNLDSRIVYTPTSTGTYYIDAGAYNEGYIGTYTVSVTRSAGPVRETFRFFDVNDGGHFFTTSTTERDQVISTRTDLRAEGVGFLAFDSTQAGSSPVFRFFDTRDGGHFFTISTVERDQVLATRPDLRFEGTAFHEFTTSRGASTDAVFRFFDRSDGGHFFTSSTVERDQVLATRPDLTYEGVAFYAPHAGVELF